MSSIDELISILEESESSIQNAIEQLDGSGLDSETNVLCLMETLADIRTEKARYEAKAAQKAEMDIEALHREYERSVL